MLRSILSAALIGAGAIPLYSQGPALPVKYEELTAPEFVQALKASQDTVLIPCGVLEKHGTHLPLGTDMLAVRELAVRAAQREYAVVFPHYFFSQIFEARHQPGTIAYSETLIWQVLQETCDELARNGFRKILLVNGHGGNTNFLTYFCQAQLAKRRDYAVFLYQGLGVQDPEIEKLRKSGGGYHAEEMETSNMMAIRPELAHPERAGQESGADQKRLSLPGLYTGIWWYASYPNHYSGDASVATKRLGELALDKGVEALAKTLKTLKADTSTLALQKEFHDRSDKPSGQR